MTTDREVIALTPIADDPEVGRWPAALEHARSDTLRELEGVTRNMVDWYPDAPLTSIGSLLYHIALEAEHRSHIAWLRDTYRAPVTSDRALEPISRLVRPATQPEAKPGSFGRFLAPRER